MYYSRNSSYQSYRQNSVMTASPVELIIMLYEGAIKHLRFAKLHIADKRLDKANEELKKSEDIVQELAHSLDMKFPLSKDLLSLYEFLLEEIVQCNMTKSAQRIDPVIEMLEELLEAWKEIKVDNRPAMLQGD